MIECLVTLTRPLCNVFKDVTVNTPHRASRLMETFGPTMEEKTLKDFRGYAQGRLAPCMTPETFDTLVDKTREPSEFAGQIQPNGDLVKETPGQFGTVLEPNPSRLDENEATVSVHTHHPHIGVEPRLFNPLHRKILSASRADERWAC